MVKEGRNRTNQLQAGRLPIPGAARLVTALLAALLAAGCGEVRPACCPAQAPEAAPAVVYVVGHGWHAGLVLRRADLAPGAWPEADLFGGAAYLEVGWGDAGFYPAPAPGAGLLLKAALWPTPSVLHVAAFDPPPDRFFPGSEVIRVALCREGLADLVRYIRAAYARDAEGRAVEAGPGLYGESRFFRSRGRYHLLNNCNHWIARALRRAGCPTAPGRALTVTDVMRQVHRFGEPVRLNDLGL